MFILLPFIIFVVTLIIIVLILTVSYTLYDTFKNPHYKKKFTPTKGYPIWWKNPYWYIGFILFIVVGIISYFASIFTVIGLGYLITIFD